MRPLKKKVKTVTNNDYHKVYDALKVCQPLKSVTFSSKEEQYEKLTETMGDNWKIFEGDANPLYDAYIVDTNTPSDVKTVAEEAKKSRCIRSSRLVVLIQNACLS